MMRRRMSRKPPFTLMGWPVLLAAAAAWLGQSEAVAQSVTSWGFAALGRQAPGTEPQAVRQPKEKGAPTTIEDRTEPQLSPEMLALRDKTRRALAAFQSQSFNTRDNTPGELIHWCLPLGCDAEVAYGSPTGRKINAVGCLCWNLPCAGGYRLLQVSDGRVVPKVGYGLQAHPAEFLAMLAQSAVPIDYEIRIGDFRGTVADLVEHEKRRCAPGADLSFALIGLSHYLMGEESGAEFQPVDGEDGQDADPPTSWKNDLGQEWSIERIVGEELDRAGSLSEAELTHCLMGLSYAVDRRIRCSLPIEGESLRAREYVGELQQLALAHQNPDGTWHPSFFTQKGNSSDQAGTLRSTGHILRWLAFSLPEGQLHDPRVVRSVTFVSGALGSRRSSQKMAPMSPRDVDAMTHAAHALAIYDRRAFQPADRPPAPDEVEADGPQISNPRTAGSRQ